MWLLRQLIPNPENPKERMIKGCQIFFPDTAFYTKDGKTECVIQNDKDGCLSFLLEQKKLLPSAISKKIQEIVRAR